MKITKKEILGDKKQTRSVLADEVLELYDIIEMKDSAAWDQEKAHNNRSLQMQNHIDFLNSEMKQKERELLRLKNVIVELAAKMAFGEIK